MGTAAVHFSLTLLYAHYLFCYFTTVSSQIEGEKKSSSQMESVNEKTASSCCAHVQRGLN